jgi:hypothetical protein
LAMRRAVLEQKLLASPAPDAATLVELLATRAAAGDARVRMAIIALASAIVERRRAGDVATLTAIAVAAEEAGHAMARSLFSDDAAPRRLCKNARLPEVGLNREGYFPTRMPTERHDWYESDTAGFQRIASIGYAYLGNDLRLLETMLLHPDEAFIARLLRTRWIRQRDVLRVAARRPSTAAIAMAVAANDRWFCDPRVRAALAANPFTPSWLASATRLTTATPAAFQGLLEDCEPVTDDAL